MENLRVLNSKERKLINEMMLSQYGTNLEDEYEIYMNSENKVFIMTKDIVRVDLSNLRVNSMGLYFGEIYQNQLRLSFDGAIMIGKKAKNLLELDDEQARKWLSGEDFEIDTEFSGYVIVMNEDDVLGCGKVSNRKLYNYVPKERRRGK